MANVHGNIFTKPVAGGGGGGGGLTINQILPETSKQFVDLFTKYGSNKPGLSKKNGCEIGVNISRGEAEQDVPGNPGYVMPGVYGTDYSYNLNSYVDFFETFEADCYRIPVKWERIQQTLYGGLQAEIVNLDALINYITVTKKKKCILDLHNYGRRRLNLADHTSKTLIGNPALPIAALTDLWLKLGARYKDNPLVIFDLMNEPIFQTPIEWIGYMNIVTEEMRKAGIGNLLHISLPDYSSGWYFYGYAHNVALEKYYDPYDNWQLAVHQYGDPGGDGGDSDAALLTSTNVFEIRLRNVVNYCRSRGISLVIGEFGISTNALNLQALAGFMRFIHENSDVIKTAIAWGGGLWGDNYPYKLSQYVTGGGTPPQTTRLFAQKKPVDEVTGADIFIDYCEKKVAGARSVQDLISLSRNSRGSAFDKKGKLIWFDQNQSRQTDLGFLNEEQRANLQPSALWEKNAAAQLLGVSISRPADLFAPDGSKNAIRLKDYTDGVTSTRHDMILGTVEFTAAEITANTEFCYSIFSKYVDFDTPILYTVSPSTGLIIPFATTERIYREDWVRWAQSFVPTAITANLRAGFTKTATQSAEVYVGLGNQIDFAYPQIEAGKFPTSPIFKEKIGTPAIRQADDAAFIGRALELAQGATFTCVIEISQCPEAAVILPILTVNGGIVALRSNADYSAGGSFGATITTTPALDGLRSRRASKRYGFSINRTTGKVCVGVEAVSCVEGSATIPAVTDFKLGNCNGYIKKIWLFNSYKTPAELGALITPA
jgi:endoglucanase